MLIIICLSFYNIFISTLVDILTTLQTPDHFFFCTCAHCRDLIFKLLSNVLGISRVYFLWWALFVVCMWVCLAHSFSITNVVPSTWVFMNCKWPSSTKHYFNLRFLFYLRIVFVLLIFILLYENAYNNSTSINLLQNRKQKEEEEGSNHT